MKYRFGLKIYGSKKGAALAVNELNGRRTHGFWKIITEVENKKNIGLHAAPGPRYAHPCPSFK